MPRRRLAGLLMTPTRTKLLRGHKCCYSCAPVRLTFSTRTTLAAVRHIVSPYRMQAPWVKVIDYASGTAMALTMPAARRFAVQRWHNAGFIPYCNPEDCISGSNLFRLACSQAERVVYVRRRCRSQRYTSTGMLLWVRTLTVWLPKTTADMPLRPCDAITIKSHPLFWAVSMMPW